MSKKTFSQIAAEVGGSLPTTFGFNDGREQECLAYVQKVASKDVHSAIRAIDEYCYKSKWMMNVGDVKGKLLQDALSRRKPRLVLELGTYVGYSSLRMLAVLPSDAKIITVEPNAKVAEIARAMFAHAGVASRVTVVNGYLQDGGKTADAIETIHAVSKGCIEFVFIDHDKDAYLPDLRLILDRAWLAPGAVAFADNVLFPGSPEYRKFMKDNEGSLFRTIEYKTLLEYQESVPDLVLESVYLAKTKL